MFTHANMLVLKVTKDCNLRCKYCYIHDKDDFKDQIIDFELFKTIVNKIIEDRIKSIYNYAKPFKIVFHGGEPTLLGRDNLVKMFDYAQSSFNAYNMALSIGIQSNMTLVDEELVAIFRKYNVDVGFSFDGIKKGNQARIPGSQEGYFLEKFNLLDKYKINYGLLLVVSQANINEYKEATQFLIDKYDKQYKSNYVEDVLSPTEDSDIEVSGKDFFEKVVKLEIDRFIETGKCYEGNISRIIEKLCFFEMVNATYNEKSNCYNKFCGAGISVVEMEPNGNVGLCGRYSKEYPDTHISNVKDYDFLDLHQIKTHFNFNKQKSDIIKEIGCDICNADLICDHGCMAFHYSKYGKFGIRNNLICDIFKNTYNYLTLNMDKILVNYLKSLNIVPNTPYRLKCNGAIIHSVRNNKVFMDAISELKIRATMDPKDKYSLVLNCEGDKIG